MNRSVLLLLLSLCSLGMCQEEDYSYHFVSISKSWPKAQEYCRKHYTDLATVSDRADAQRICRGSAKCPGNEGAWIGLQHNESLTETWRWTQPGLECVTSEAKQWHPGQPNKNKREKCVLTRNNEWHDSDCSTLEQFICYNESTNSSVVLNVTKTWLGALQYCREHHTDLIGGTQTIPEVSGDHWIGLFRDSWEWSDGSSSSFRNWDEEEEVLNNNWNKDNQCARLDKNGKKCKSADCTDEKPFVCYDDQMILIKEKKTWEEALLHCRRNYGELAVMSSFSQCRMVQARADGAGSQFVWVGLHYTCFFEEWIWVDGRYAGEGKWDGNKEPHECGLAGAVKRDGSRKWFGRSSEDKYNFVCSVSCRSKNSMGSCYKK